MRTRRRRRKNFFEGRKEGRKKRKNFTKEQREKRKKKPANEKKPHSQKLLFCARGSKATTTTMNFVDANKKPTNTGGIDETVKLAGGKLDGLVGMDEDGDMQKDYTWDCVVFGDGSL